jgi:hypothetical protein
MLVRNYLNESKSEQFRSILKLRSLALLKKKLIICLTSGLDAPLTLSSIYTHFYVCATSVDSDQPAHSCHLIRICTGHILVRNNLVNHRTNSLDPDQMAWMFWLIWIKLFANAIKVIYEGKG